MAKKKLDTTCPSCKEHFLTEVELPDPPDLKSAVKEVVDEAISKVQRHNGEMDEAVKQLQAANTEIEAWRSGKNHQRGDALLRELQECPECKPYLDKHMEKARADWQKGLSLDEAKAIAKAHKLYPPPGFEVAKVKAAK